MGIGTLNARQFSDFFSPRAIMFSIFTFQGQFRDPETKKWRAVLKRHDAINGRDEFVLCGKRCLKEMADYLSAIDVQDGSYAIMAKRCAEKAGIVAGRAETARDRLLDVQEKPSLSSLFPRARRLLAEQFGDAAVAGSGVVVPFKRPALQVVQPDQPVAAHA